MPVTEFAILALRHGHDEPGLLETLSQCQELQDQWMRRNQPSSVEPHIGFSSMYLERPGPGPSLLITAPWESAEAHGEWLQSQENQACNDKLGEYIVPGCDSVLLFHMEPAGTRAQPRRDVFARGTFSICRVFIDADRRDSLQQAYRSLEKDLLDQGVQDHVWAGWKLEASGDAQELVVFWSDNVPDERLRHLTSFSDKKSQHRFSHAV